MAIAFLHPTICSTSIAILPNFASAIVTRELLQHSIHVKALGTITDELSDNLDALLTRALGAQRERQRHQALGRKGERLLAARNAEALLLCGAEPEERTLREALAVAGRLAAQLAHR